MKTNAFKKWQRFFGVAVLAVLMAGCSTMNVGDAPKLPKTASWVILPIANTTETPDAGQAAVGRLCGLPVTVPDSASRVQLR